MGNKAFDTELFDRAAIFAINAHHCTERRGKASPYVIHVMEAAAIVAEMTNDQELLAAAVLHDVVEDTDVSIEDISAEFGDRIADLVDSESDPEFPGLSESESWLARKKYAIDRLASASRDAKIVALGDKLSNMRAIALDYEKQGDALWKIFHVDDPKLHEWRYRALADAMKELENEAPYREFCDLIEKTFPKG